MNIYVTNLCAHNVRRLVKEIHIEIWECLFGFATVNYNACLYLYMIQQIDILHPLIHSNPNVLMPRVIILCYQSTSLIFSSFFYTPSKIWLKHVHPHPPKDTNVCAYAHRQVHTLSFTIHIGNKLRVQLCLWRHKCTHTQASALSHNPHWEECVSSFMYKET